MPDSTLTFHPVGDTGIYVYTRCEGCGEPLRAIAIEGETVHREEHDHAR